MAEELTVRMTLDLHREGRLDLGLIKMDHGNDTDAMLGYTAADLLRRSCPDIACEAEVLSNFLCRYLDGLTVPEGQDNERKFIDAINAAYDAYQASLRTD